ncbi:MAG: alkaline phosphatase family protein [Cyclobacteriaceae bacterium]
MNKRLLFFLWIVVSLQGLAQSKLKTENIILITFDGLRWQELFNGADSTFMKQQPFLKDPKLKEKYWHTDATVRRKLLLPFIWGTIASKGQIYGNRAYGSMVNVSNKMWFSYPGYNELLTGKADDARINSNNKMYNPNTTVLEFLNSQPAFKGKVAAFTSWDCFPYIINDKRSGVFVSAGIVPAAGGRLSEREMVINQVMSATPNPLGDVRLDAFTFYLGMEYIKKNKPRVMYFAFDETDDFAHGGEYAAYLNAAHYTDRFIGELWNYLQSDDQYRNKTTILITTDHGRGTDAESWKHHGIKIPEADQIWMAVIGPDTKPMGEVKASGQLFQKQIAKTMAAFLGLEFEVGTESTGPVQTMLGGQ